MSELVYINTKNIFPHPDNPRKDLGDLAELVDSIKANGILQNLTVVPFFGAEEVDPENGKFTVIIGHRRLAAAKQAGLEKVPCVVAQMSKEEQIATMLAENMQRSDLTVYEQAKSFQQLSIDFGKTVADISAMSGFSETTVRRRTKLADLDEKKFEKACKRGATLFDFVELDKVEDPADKEACLEVMGTQNFKNTLKSILDKQKTRAKMAEWEKQLAAFATKVERQGYIGKRVVEMDYVRNWGSWTRNGDIEVPEDAKEVRYFYVVSDIQISLYKEHVADPEKDAQREEEQRLRDIQEARYHALMEISRRHYELRCDFIRNYGSAKQNLTAIIRNAATEMSKDGNHVTYRKPLDLDDLASIMGLHFNRQEMNIEGFRTQASDSPEKTLLAVTYWYMERGQQTYVRRQWNADVQRNENRYTDNQILDNIYYFLEELGYECSDEERQMRRGAHPLFDKAGEES